MTNKLKILHISDSHSYHNLLNIPDNVDIIIHSGDYSNYRDYYKNEPETRDFLNWYGALDIKYKVLISGNHDAMASINPTEFRDICNQKNIIYLENESIEIEGIKIFGTPIQPTFGNWYFQKPRHKLDEFWKTIPIDTDILVVHGPPKGLLDLSYNREGTLEYCGCKSLRNHVLNRLNLKACMFGHIHNYEDIINAGVTKLSIKDTLFSNGSIVCDGKFGYLISNGNLFEYDIETKIIKVTNE